MKTTLLAVFLAAGAFGFASPVVAQTSTTVETTTIEPQERTAIREYITRERTSSVAVPSGFSLSVGATLPPTVELHSFPSTVGVRHRYVVMNNRTVLVESSSRRVIQIID